MFDSNEVQVMLDLETLDTKSSAIIVSIGVVAFDFYRGVLGKSFFPIQLNVQEVVGRTVSVSCFQWWLAQDAAARSQFCENPYLPANVIYAINGFFSGHKCKAIWANSPAFDCATWDSFCASFDAEPWFEFWQQRDYRTVKALYPHIKLDDFQGEKHNALDDALSQTNHLLKIAEYHRSLIKP